MGKAARLRQAGRKGPAFERSAAPAVVPGAVARTGRDVTTEHGVCLGVEIEHSDGITECGNGTLCPGGPHPVGIQLSCGMARGMGRYDVLHVCPAC
jgi:hypothetical protein